MFGAFKQNTFGAEVNTVSGGGLFRSDFPVCDFGVGCHSYEIAFFIVVAGHNYSRVGFGLILVSPAPARGA
jgi:hypothetical protein